MTKKTKTETKKLDSRLRGNDKEKEKTWAGRPRYTWARCPRYGKHSLLPCYSFFIRIIRVLLFLLLLITDN